LAIFLISLSCAIQIPAGALSFKVWIRQEELIVAQNGIMKVLLEVLGAVERLVWLDGRGGGRGVVVFRIGATGHVGELLEELHLVLRIRLIFTLGILSLRSPFTIWLHLVTPPILTRAPCLIRIRSSLGPRAKRRLPLISSGQR